MKTLHFIFSVALAILSVPGFASEGYPDRPVRIVVPYPPGGSADVIARTVANELRRQYNQSFVVDNKAGAAGMIGATIVAKASPDGYTLLLTAASHSVLPALKADMPYDTVRDLIPVSIVATTQSMVLVREDHPAKNFGQLLEMAKANAGGVNVGIPGIGTTNHITLAMLAQATGTKFNSVPYKGSAPLSQALLGGEVPVMIGSTISAGALEGKVRALVAVGPDRSSFYPEVPTFQELGIDPVLGNSWFGILAPAGTPPAIVERISAAMKTASERPEFQASLRALRLETKIQGPDEFSRILQQEVKVYREVVRGLGIEPN